MFQCKMCMERNMIVDFVMLVITIDYEQATPLLSQASG